MLNFTFQGYDENIYEEDDTAAAYDDDKPSDDFQCFSQLVISKPHFISIIITNDVNFSIISNNKNP